MLIITSHSDAVAAATHALPDGIADHINHHWRLATERGLEDLTCIVVTHSGDPSIRNFINRKADWSVVTPHFTEHIYTVGNGGFAYIIITYPPQTAVPNKPQACKP